MILKPSDFERPVNYSGKDYVLSHTKWKVAFVHGICSAMHGNIFGLPFGTYGKYIEPMDYMLF